MKRYPKSKNPSKMVGVARGHQRADTLERSDTMWSTGEGIIVIVYIIVPKNKTNKQTNKNKTKQTMHFAIEKQRHTLVCP